MIIGRCNSSENSRNRYDETFCIFSFMQDADGIWRAHLKFCCKIILMIVFLISFFWFFYAIYTYINQGQHVGLFVFVGVFFAAIGIMGIISCYTRYFEIDPNNKIIVYGAYNKKYSKNKYLIKFSSVSYITIKKREIPAYPVTTLPSYSILLVDKFGDNKFILSGNYKDITMIANSISKILDVDIVL